MIRVFALAGVLASMSSHALDFNCVMDLNPEVKVTGSTTDKDASIQIKDEKGRLGLKELSPTKVVQMERNLRKREDRYAFAKYLSDFNAWQDLEISIPKNLTSNRFTAFVTIYTDNGDDMVPDGGSKFSCIAK